MNKKIIMTLLAAIVGTTAISVYAGAALFFKDSFYYGSKIGNMDVGGYTPQQVQAAISTQGEKTTLTLYGRGVEKQTISGKDINLKYSIKENLDQVKKQQSPLLWPKGLMGESKLKVTQSIEYDKQALSDAIDHLSYFQKENIIPPKDADVEFNGTEYAITPEEQGKQPDKEKVTQAVVKALEQGKTAIELDQQGCYLEPQYTRDSSQLAVAKDKLNQYIKADITYNFGSKQEKVTPQMISSWLKLNQEKEADIDEEKVKAYVDGLAKTYNTYGVTRSFRTSLGNTVQVSGGDYGWSINKKAEVKALEEAIKTGKTINREPAANPDGASSYINTGIGSSYVEINLSRQHLWFYKNGKLVTQGDVVTGDKSRKRETPPGVYKLDYKQRNATLRGPGYATPVSFWMPFNGGIGIHDAVWRSRFGGKIYVNNGSHGCVNASYQLAKTIYNSIDESIPIICYY